MWQLYNLLKTDNPPKEFLLDEVTEILSVFPPPVIKDALKFMYKKLNIVDPLQVGLLLTKGLLKNKFFEFRTFIKDLHDNS